MTISKTSVDRLSRLEPPPPAQPLTDRALRRLVRAEMKAAAEHYGVDANDLDTLADIADRDGEHAHVGARVAALLCDVQDRINELDLG